MGFGGSAIAVWGCMRCAIAVGGLRKYVSEAYRRYRFWGMWRRCDRCLEFWGSAIVKIDLIYKLPNNINQT
ncbi:MAG: hypothetical protein ACKO9I_15685 [Sphaerospermopsis kisseleviana]